VEEALRRASLHARTALGEGLAAARALLDAVALGLSGSAARDHAALATLGQALDDLESALRGDAEAAEQPDPISTTLLEALDLEIARWQERARHDREARSVLRAFIALREVLWEMGIRPAARPGGPEAATGAEPAPPAPQARRDARKQPPAAPGRVQRVRVQG